MEVAQLALPAAVTPLCCEHDEVERRRPLDLHPRGAAAARLVGRLERLDDDALVPVGERVLEESLRVVGTAELGARNPNGVGHGPSERLNAF